MWVGKGNEFYNRSMKPWLQKKNMKTHSEEKSVAAERFIETLKNKICKYLTSVLKNILIFGKGSTPVFDDITLTAEKQCSINFTEQHKTFCLSLHYEGSNTFEFANVVEIYKHKAKDSKINAAPLSLGNISKDFSSDNMKNARLYEYIYNFSVDYDAIVDDILDIDKYL